MKKAQLRNNFLRDIEPKRTKKCIQNKKITAYNLTQIL